VPFSQRLQSICPEELTLLSGVKALSHVLFGLRALSHVIFGLKALSHVLFGLKALSHVLLGLKALSLVLFEFDHFPPRFLENVVRQALLNFLIKK
jgi:hypothetical protein